jgi:hypothetical protein
MAAPAASNSRVKASSTDRIPCITYLHTSILEMHCLHRYADSAIAAAASSPGVYWIEPKNVITTRNWSGRSVIGTGSTQTFTALQPNASKVFASVSMQNSIIGAADSGLSINNCYFCSLNSSAFRFYIAAKHSDHSSTGNGCDSAVGSASARNVKKWPSHRECCRII